MGKLEVMLNALESGDYHPVKSGDRWRSKCPSHGSRGGTLLVDSQGSFHCFAGCEASEILSALGLGWKDLFEEGHVFKRVPRRKSPPVGTYRSMIGAAVRLGLVTAYSGNGVHVGVCPCCGETSLSIGREGIVCLQGCPAESLVITLGDVQDANKIMVGVKVNKVLEVLGCYEERSGISAKTGKPWTLYKVHANSEDGTPVEETLKSFNELPVGKGTFVVTKQDHPEYGVSYTVSQQSGQSLRLDDLERRIELLEGKKPVVPTPAPVVAVPASDGVPF